MSVMKQTGKPNLPPAAEVEILEYLGEHHCISSDEIANILKKHKVKGKAEALQHSYRKRLGQRLMASIRDEEGKREILAVGQNYVILDCCNDKNTLEKIGEKIVNYKESITESEDKVGQRMKVLNRFSVERLIK